MPSRRPLMAALALSEKIPRHEPFACPLAADTGDGPAAAVDDRAAGDDDLLLVYPLQPAAACALRLRGVGELRVFRDRSIVRRGRAEHGAVARQRDHHHRAAGRGAGAGDRCAVSGAVFGAAGADRALFRDAHGQCPALEAHDDEPHLRGAGAGLAVLWRAAGGLAHRLPAAVRDHHGRLAMAAVCHADLHDRAAGHEPRAARSRAHGWRQLPAATALPVHAASGALGGGGGDDRDDFPARHLCRDQHHHQRRPGRCEHQRDVFDLQAGPAQLRCRRGLGRRAVRRAAGQHRCLVPDPHGGQKPRPMSCTMTVTRRRSSPPLGPLARLLLTAFKTELQAISVPPLLWFTPTLENFLEVQERSDYLLYAGNSVITSVLSTLLGLLLAAPAAYAMAFFKGRYTKDILMWMLSTKMMPAVGALVPIYVLAQKSQLLDTRLALIIVFTLSNLPIMVWMLYSHFKDIPHEILEAARMDGATLWQEVRLVLLPLGMGGLASTGLLCLVLAWNEAFWSLNLSAAKAGTLATLIASYSSTEGLFWAKLSAASLMAIAPIVVFGWFSQKQLVKGLTFGAVK